MKIINVSSGKGGTGKTMITAVIAELLSRKNKLSVLVVDMDIFVRGLTCLLYFQGDRRIRLVEPGHATVADVISTDQDYQSNGISRYRTFDVWPSVSRIDEKLNFDDVMPDDYDQASKRVKNLLRQIPDYYDLVFLDSRAGYDELIAATHAQSDITLNVEEDDLVSRITSDNLAAQLETAAKTPIYRIVNKSLGRHPERLGDLGQIPFDADIMKSYGEELFWTNITKSYLEPALVEIWNNLCRNEKMEFQLQSTRVSPIPVADIEKRLLRIGLFERVLVLYGLVFCITGFVIGMGGIGFFRELASDPIRLVGLLTGFMGVGLAVFGLLRTGRR